MVVTSRASPELHGGTEKNYVKLLMSSSRDSLLCNVCRPDFNDFKTKRW